MVFVDDAPAPVDLAQPDREPEIQIAVRASLVRSAAALAEGLEKADRTADDVDTLIEVKVSFDVDRARALEDTRFWAPLALSAEEKMGVEDPIEMQRLANALPIERAASRFIVSDDPDEHVDRILDYADMGFRHLVFHGPGDDQERFLRTYGEEILPRLRSRLTP